MTITSTLAAPVMTPLLVRAAGAFTLGLSTTNSKESIEPYSDYVIADYSGFTFADLVKVVEENKK